MNKLITVAAVAIMLSLPAQAQDASVMAGAQPAASAEAQTSLIGRAQAKLRQEGLYAGAVSGFRNNATTRAIRRFQRTHSLRITGTLTPETRTALGI